MYTVSSDVILEGKDKTYRLSIFDDKKMITRIDTFEHYDDFRSANILINQFIAYLNSKNLKVKSGIFNKIMRRANPRLCFTCLNKHNGFGSLPCIRCVHNADNILEDSWTAEKV